MSRRLYALIIVDVQLDFCPGGSLEVPEGDSIVPVINRLTEAFQENGLPILFSRDLHPEKHMSFIEQGGMWPPHCVKGTMGADFHPLLEVPQETYIISKATRPDRDAYSAFEETELTRILREKKVTSLAVCGLATDYCVRATALDGINEGFHVVVVTDAVKGVEVNAGDIDQAFEEMKNAGVALYTSRELIKHIQPDRTE